jgi:hypothetical protein
MKVIVKDEISDFDKYHAAIVFLIAHPDVIHHAWESVGMDIGGCLFGFVNEDPTYRGEYGCLTEIRCGRHVAPTAALTNAIRRDTRIPENGDDITVEHLEVFAEWQRRLDKELNRV